MKKYRWLLLALMALLALVALLVAFLIAWLFTVGTTPTGCSDTGIKTYNCQSCGKTKTEQIQGSHPFGEWEYEEYIYQASDEWGSYTVNSHRKVRTCAKCGYKEYGNTPSHYCSKNAMEGFTDSTLEAGTCATAAKMRRTCTICGWHYDYDGKKGSHAWTDKKVHLSDYGPYTNELDATVAECTSCGTKSIVYHQGEGGSNHNRYYVNLSVNSGNAYMGGPANDNFAAYDHPEWQMVRRDFVYDSDGYVKQFTFYWWYNGQRYSQVIQCDKASMIAWFAEYGLDTNGSESYIVKPDGRHIVPYKITYTG